MISGDSISAIGLIRVVSVYMEVSSNGRYPIPGWFIEEILTEMDDLGVPLFQETSIYIPVAQHKAVVEVSKIGNR